MNTNGLMQLEGISSKCYSDMTMKVTHLIIMTSETPALNGLILGLGSHKSRYTHHRRTW